VRNGLQRIAFRAALAVALAIAAHGATRGAPAAEGVAFPGRPFGVGRLTLTADAGAAGDLNRFDIRDADQRVFYPVFRVGNASESRSGLLGIHRRTAARTLDVWFLFQGDAPLDVIVHVPEPQRFVLTPVDSRDRGYERLLGQWHGQYNASAASEAESDAGARSLQIYLTSMLAHRLGLAPPRLTPEGDASELQRTAELLLGSERLRDELQRQAWRGVDDEPAQYAVPAPIQWVEPEFPALAADVEIEPIALHVPAECFYVRFGNFPNYLWLTDLADEHGGDLGRMLAVRARDAKLGRRMERQLALRKSALADLLGPHVISDVAIIGRDLYLQEGAAMAMLFEASNGLALGADIYQQRQAALQAFRSQGATLETVSIAGRDVSFLSTPDNTLRSFYAVDGKYHLVSTSRVIVERFFQSGEGQGALGQAAEFLVARQELPLSRGDAITAYFSSAFFEGLLSPHYQIEMQRRLRAATDIQLIQLAQLVAASERLEDDQIDDLVAAGLLPRGFGWHPDGGGPIVATSGIIDARRGPRGSFTPIPDVPVEAVTAAEAQQFARRAAYYEESWRQMDPLMIGVQRTTLDEPGRERLSIDAYIAPLLEEKYGRFLSMIGPPTGVQIETPPTDIASLQASLQGDAGSPDGTPHHLFAGVEDTAPAIAGEPDGTLEWLLLLRTTPGYLGSWPKLGLLDRLPLRAARGPDVEGFSQLPLGLWRWQQNGISLLSFDREVLERAAGSVRPVAAADAAQVRGRVGDLSGSQLGGWLSRLEYERAARGSAGNVRLLNTLIQQFHVPHHDALTIAEGLLDTQLVCTLGGEYKAADDLATPLAWHSTAWNREGPPTDYVAPLLQWFRGGEFQLTKQDGRLRVHAKTELQRQPAKPASAKPSLLDFFSLPSRDVEADRDQETGRDADSTADADATDPAPRRESPRASSDGAAPRE